MGVLLFQYACLASISNSLNKTAITCELLLGQTQCCSYATIGYKGKQTNHFISVTLGSGENGRKSLWELNAIKVAFGHPP